MIQDSEPKCDQCGHILPLAGPCENCGTRPKGLHVYIAGSFRDRERVRRCMKEARACGMHVVHDWPDIIEKSHGEDRELPVDVAREHALGDIEALRGAHILWLLSPPAGEGRGSWVELGIASEMGKAIVVSGPTCSHSIFTALGERYFRDDDALNHILDRWWEGEFDGESSERGYHCGSGRLCNVGACSCNCQPCRRADRVDEKQAAFDAEHRRRPVVSDLRDTSRERRPITCHRVAHEDAIRDRLDVIEQTVAHNDSEGAGAFKYAIERIARLERGLAKLRAGGAPESRREHATAAFAYVCGRTRKPMPVPDGEVPLCREPIPGAEGVACPFPAPCPYHPMEPQKPAEDAAE